MDQARDDIFADSAFAGDEDFRVRSSSAVDLLLEYPTAQHLLQREWFS